MKRNLTPIASGVALLLMGAALSAQAQEADSNIQTVVTTGIRASLQQSLNVKRRATTNVEVVTAEDVGKMPDKNVADTLQRLPGVSISQSAAGSGGFDENDRVSLRGTSPSLTNVTVNGHSVSSGDWFILDQVGGAVGRSVSFSLLPSEIVGQVVVNKTPTADQIEGGVAGSVDIHTRHPLDTKQQLAIDGSVQAVYATLPGTTDPQYSGSVNWKNESGTFGVMAQYFNEKRHLRRDGQEMLTWMPVGADNAAVLGTAGIAASVDPTAYGTPVVNTGPHPDLVGVYAPRLIGSTLFEQVRQRKGGILDFEIKPTKDLTLEATYFKSSMDASNYNRNYMMDLGAGAGDIGLFAQNWNTTVGHNSNAPDPGYTIQNGTLTHAMWSNLPAGSRVGIVDDIARPGEGSSTQFFDFDGKFRATDNFTLSGKIGESKGTGTTPVQNVYEGNVNVNAGGSVWYTLHGTDSPADVGFSGLTTGDTSTFTGTTLDWIFGAVDTWTKDEDKYGQIDGEYNLGSGLFTDLKFGYRHTSHRRWNNMVNQGPYRNGTFTDANGNAYVTNATPTGTSSINPAWNGTTYPSDFGSGLGGGNFPHQPWQLTEDQLAQFTSTYAWQDPVYRTDYELMYNQQEKTDAMYVNADFAGQGWSGNAGVRFVKTKDHVDNYQIVPGTTSTGQAITIAQATANGWLINGGGQGGSFAYPASYVVPQSDENDSSAALPSLNLKFDLDKNLIARVGLSRTMTRPDFGALAGVTSTDDQTELGNAGNSQLKPITSDNLDLALQWYYAPRALLSAGVFYMDMQNYVGFANVNQSLFNEQISDRTGVSTFSNYTITKPVNVGASVAGLELNAQVPIGGGFGVDSNFTYADGKENSDDCPVWTTTTASSPCDLLGTSKTTYNVGAFFENDVFNARVGWSWRSDYLAAYDRNAPLYQAATGSLAVSANYFINKNVSLTFSGENVNQPVLKNYVFNETQPRSFYQNGAQYYAGVRFKF